MSYGKKWKMTRKQMVEIRIIEDGDTTFVEVAKENVDFNSLDIRNGLKS